MKTVKIVIDKPMAQDLVITLFSDVHLGKTIRTGYLDKIIQISNKQHPDIVLIAGDLFDEDVNSIGVAELSASFSKIETRYGVYAVPGNHEYFSGIDNAINLLQQSGIKVLRDKVEKIDERFYLIGRDDRTLQQFGGKRASIEELFQNIDAKLPIILMDHQPFHLEEAVHNAVDLQVSGHTHHGQFFPFNLVTNAMYEKSWGYLKKNHTHFYVSCGAGTWGPPVRIGSTSEILRIEIKGLPE